MVLKSLIRIYLKGGGRKENDFNVVTSFGDGMKYYC